MDLLEEYDTFFKEMGDHASATYKFFDLFKINLGDAPEDGMTKGLHFGKMATDAALTDEQLRALKAYLKTQRSWLRKGLKDVNRAECRRRMWFWMQKLYELGAFDRPTRRDIIHWMDICTERTMEGCQYKIESVAGKPTYMNDYTTN